MERPFDLTSPPLIRFQVHILSDTCFRVVGTECHPTTDGWSWYSLLVEIVNAYSALITKSNVRPADPPSACYRDFVAAELQLLKTSEYKEFWRHKLGDRITTTVRPWPRLPRSVSSSRYQVILLPIDESLYAKLLHLARE